MIHAVLKGISDALSLEFGYGVYIEEIPQDLQVVDGVLHFFVNYDFYMKKTEEQTVMAELKSQINMKG